MPAIVLKALILGLICVGGTVKHEDDSVPIENTYVQKFTISPSSGWWCDDSYHKHMSRNCYPKHKIGHISDTELMFDDTGKHSYAYYSLDLKTGIMSAIITLSADYEPPGPQKLACKVVSLEDARHTSSTER